MGDIELVRTNYNNANALHAWLHVDVMVNLNYF